MPNSSSTIVVATKKITWRTINWIQFPENKESWTKYKNEKEGTKDRLF